MDPSLYADILAIVIIVLFALLLFFIKDRLRKPISRHYEPKPTKRQRKNRHGLKSSSKPLIPRERRQK